MLNALCACSTAATALLCPQHKAVQRSAVQCGTVQSCAAQLRLPSNSKRYRGSTHYHDGMIVLFSPDITSHRGPGQYVQRTGLPQCTPYVVRCFSTKKQLSFSVSPPYCPHFKPVKKELRKEQGSSPKNQHRSPAPVVLKYCLLFCILTLPPEMNRLQNKNRRQETISRHQCRPNKKGL